MFFSNSLLIIQVDNLDFKSSLKDHYFFEENESAEISRKFFSINFHNTAKDSGEIHYTNSYENGNMNLLNFRRENNIFFLFTSSVQHTKFFRKILSTMAHNDNISYKTIKIPVSNNILPKLDIENFTVVEADGLFGIKGFLTFQGTKQIIKIYNNGVVMFPFTNNKELVKEVMKTSLNIIGKYESLY